MLYALDCEMVETAVDKRALVRVCVVDAAGESVLDVRAPLHSLIVLREVLHAWQGKFSVLRHGGCVGDLSSIHSSMRFWHAPDLVPKKGVKGLHAV